MVAGEELAQGEYINGLQGDEMSRGKETPEELIGGLLRSKGLSLGLAESCTGGMISARITGVPGSSEYFAGGVVSYHNRVKEEVLGVPGDQLSEYGAVSEEVVRSMAAGARRVLKTDIGLAVTGIAGPGGGTPSKPVGLVYLALDTPDETVVRKLMLEGNRLQIRTRVSEEAMDMLRKYLEKGKKKN